MPAGRSSARTRPRVERAQNSSGTDIERGLREAAREVLPELAEYLKANISTDPEARKMVMDLTKADLDRSRAGDQDELLMRLKAVREAGSATLQEYWGKVYASR